MLRTRAIQLLQNVARRQMATTPGRDRKGEKCINQVQLLGRIGTNPVVRGENNNIVTFTLATNEYYKSPTEDGSSGSSESWKQIASWHNITVFRPGLRDIVSAYCKSGDRVMVTGKLSYRKYQDDNQKTINVPNVIADDLIFFRSSAPPEGTELHQDDDEGFIDQGFK